MGRKRVGGLFEMGGGTSVSIWSRRHIWWILTSLMKAGLDFGAGVLAMGLVRAALELTK